MAEIKSIQFRRGNKAILEKKLKAGALGQPADGEPIFERDTGKLKIGNGVTDYVDLKYVDWDHSGGGGGEDERFVIVDPVDGQCLLYDSTSGKWVNKDLADKESIIYLAEHGLTIKGYTDAKQGQMLVKDTTDGLAWIDPLSTETLQSYVTQAQNAATDASKSASSASAASSDAEISAGVAERINQQTMNWVNGKFWWGTLAEYNALESITDGTFYFITDSVE